MQETQVRVTVTKSKDPSRVEVAFRALQRSKLSADVARAYSKSLRGVASMYFADVEIPCDLDWLIEIRSEKEIVRQWISIHGLEDLAEVEHGALS